MNEFEMKSAVERGDCDAIEKSGCAQMAREYIMSIKNPRKRVDTIAKNLPLFKREGQVRV